MTQAAPMATPTKFRRARQETNLRYANDGSYASVEALLHQLAIKCHARVKAMGLNLEYDDVLQEMNMSYVKALKAWKPDGGSLFSTYCRTACLNNFNKSIERLETERREMGMTSIHMIVSSDSGDIDPLEILGADSAPESDSPAFRLERSQAMAEQLKALTPNARRLIASLLNAEQDRDPSVKLASLRDITRKLNLSPDELRRVKVEILQVYGVKWN